MDKIIARARQLLGLEGNGDGKLGLPCFQKSFECGSGERMTRQGLQACGFDTIGGVVSGKIDDPHGLAKVSHRVGMEHGLYIAGRIWANTGCSVAQVANRIISHHRLNVVRKIVRITEASARGALITFYKSEV